MHPDVPIGVRIQNREENLNYLKNKEQELKRRNEVQVKEKENAQVQNQPDADQVGCL